MAVKIKAEKLRKFATQLGQKIGLSEKDAYTLSESLVFANLRGIDSHGIVRLPFYLKRLETRGTNMNPVIKVIKEKPSLILLDGDNGMGQVVGRYASDMVTKRAKETGMAYVAVKGSSHFGVASYYAYHIAKKDMVGIAISNATAVMAAWGGAKRIIGNNPLAFSVPYKKNKPILLDISMSGVAGGKIRLYAKNNQEIPKGWILDKEGKETTNPNDLLTGGTLLPFGQHKGYGIAVAIEILTGVMTGAGMMGQIPLWIKDLVSPLNIGHVFIAIDITNFMDLATFKKRLSWMVKKLKTSPISEDSSGIYFPGELERLTYLKRNKEGIPITSEIWSDLKALSQKYKVKLPLKPDIKK
ncbi:MAG: Ldh family oxidoreductase [Candidatus Atribacteria bacterium]|jgi:LDH2 family malate/lactate/ureidoglycolate dehydrogenase|nr:Ldh family oxidoreductase [Candidatus Atribacteria bacterium]